MTAFETGRDWSNADMQYNNNYTANMFPHVASQNLKQTHAHTHTHTVCVQLAAVYIIHTAPTSAYSGCIYGYRSVYSILKERFNLIIV